MGRKREGGARRRGRRARAVEVGTVVGMRLLCGWGGWTAAKRRQPSPSLYTDGQLLLLLPPASAPPASALPGDSSEANPYGPTSTQASTRNAPCQPQRRNRQARGGSVTRGGGRAHATTAAVRACASMPVVFSAPPLHAREYAHPQPGVRHTAVPTAPPSAPRQCRT